MKFLFKTTFLILVSMSNSALGITADELLKEVNDMRQMEQEAKALFEQEEKALSEKINDVQNQLEQLAKVAENIDEIIDSHNCNCTKLNLLNNEELNIAQAQLFESHGYTTPKSEKRIQEEIEDFVELFPELASDKEKYTEEVKKGNEKMKCAQKILRAINKLKKQNKSE